jgi:hypothetical protein
MNPAIKIMASFLNGVALTRRVSSSLSLIFFALAGAAPIVAYGQLELITNREAQCVFAGDARNVSVTFHNPGGKDFAGEIRTRIFQTSSATAVVHSENPWRLIQVPAGETVLASAPLDFPAVKAKTKFIVEWLADTNILGVTLVLVYPTNLLAELKPLAGDEALGVFDPQNQLKPLLKSLKIDLVNLEDSNLENFSGKLAVIGPFPSKAQMRDGLANQIKTLAVAVFDFDSKDETVRDLGPKVASAAQRQSCPPNPTLSRSSARNWRKRWANRSLACLAPSRRTARRRWAS